MSVNERLKEARVVLNLNQSEIEELSGIKQKDISRMESGLTKNIQNEYIQFLYENSINLNYIFTGAGNIKLDNSNNSVKKENEAENPKILDKSNKTENDEYHKSYHNDYHKGYILEENQGSDRVEEEQAQYTDKALKHSKSEYFEFLKKEIAFKNKIIDTLLNKEAMMSEDEIEKKVRQALLGNEKRPLRAVLNEVQKEVMKEVTTKEEAKLVGEIFVKILSKLFKE